MIIERENLDLFESKKEWNLKEFPISPSTNQLYQNAKGMGRVKSSIYKTFCREVERYRLQNLKQISEIREEIKDVKFIEVEYKFFVEKNKLFCKTIPDKPKRYDVTNRVKACEDLLCKIIKVDDSLVFKSSEEKIPSDKTYVDITIREYSREF